MTHVFFLILLAIVLISNQTSSARTGADLRAAGLAFGCKGFELAVPAGPFLLRDAATRAVLALTQAARRAA
jgi:hypothetical protein